MNNPLKNLFHHRCASNDFLLGNTETVPAPDQPTDRQPHLPKALAREFPDLLAGPAFIQRALANLETVAAF